MAGRKFSHPTMMRSTALQSKRRRFRAAYANFRTTLAYRVGNPANIRLAPTADGHHERGVPPADELMRHPLTP